MKILMRCITLLLCIATLLLVFSACSNSTDDVKINETSLVLVEAFSSLTEGNFENAIAAFTVFKAQENTLNLAVEIGLGKAYFGTGNYASAEKAFELAHSIDPGKADVVHYLGEAQMQTGNYSAAVETFGLLLGIEPDNKNAMSKLEQSLRKNKDYMGLYQFFEDRISSVVDNETEKDYYSSKLIDAVKLTKDDDLIRSTFERFNDAPIGHALDIGYRAYALFLSGDEESMKMLLFDIDGIEALIESAGRFGCYFGEYNDYGDYHGKGIIIFGSENRNAICQIYFGEFVNGEPNGTGLGYSGYINEWEDNGKTRLQKSRNFYEGEWKNGIPEGNLAITNEYTTYSEGVLEYTGKNIATAFYANRLAQGEVWTEYHHSNPNDTYGPSVSYTKHFVVDGKPVPFEVTVDGRTVMAYEAHYGETKDRANWANEEECSWCNFRF